MEAIKKQNILTIQKKQ